MSLPSYTDYLRASALPEAVVREFTTPDRPAGWARFHPIVGYVLHRYMPRDGIDGSSTLSTALPDGRRTPGRYADQRARIHTYGNSFTQCHQVSDGETWQEQLAAHLGEPIANYGMGGFGVYQAYRRMLEIETTPDCGAPHILFYIWGDDHRRSLMRCRHAVTYPWWNHQAGAMFHSNFWAHLEFKFETKTFVEVENPLPSPDALLRMCDPDFMAEALADDLMVQLCVAHHVEPRTLSLGPLALLSQYLGLPPLDPKAPRDEFLAAANHLADAYGFAATRHILQKIRHFCASQGKKLLLCTFCPTATRQLLRGEPRYDQPITDFLTAENFNHFDMNLVHQRDYADFRVDAETYLKRYLIGHYNPAGNHFFAYAIKDRLLAMLDPKPVTYRDEESRWIDFKGYLPEPPP